MADPGVTIVNECFDIVFDDAPVMMHSIGKDGRLIKVNRRWLASLGYGREEAVGRQSVDFLSKESRIRAIVDTLPLFWRVGSAHSIGYQFVRKDGQVLNLLLDAELLDIPGRDTFTLAAIYNHDSFAQWELATTTIRELKQLAQISHQWENVSAQVEDTSPDPVSGEAKAEPATQPWWLQESLGALLVTCQDLSANLRALVRLEEQQLDVAGEQQQELLVLARSIDKTLAELAHPRS